MKDDLVERCARAMCREIGRDPDECLQGTAGSNIPFECHLRLWETKTGSARAVIAIALEEAAKVADECTITLPLATGLADGGSISRRQIAAAIRALATTGQEGGR